MTTDDAGVWLTEFCRTNAQRWRASGRTDAEITGQALAVYDLWTGTPIPLDLPRLVLDTLAAAAYALDEDPDVTAEETKAVVWGFGTIATMYAEKVAGEDLVTEAERFLEDGL